MIQYKPDILSAYDNYALDVRLCLPDTGTVQKIVLFVNGSGPMTYKTKRQKPDGTFFYYFDIWADEFTKRGIGFCSYSQRGVVDGDTPPFFSEIDDAEYKKYRPHNSVIDVESIVSYLNAEYISAKIILLGWSEGTIIAPLVAERGNANVYALMLAGYCNENLKDTLIWQLSGNTTLIFLRRLFDYDKKGYITRSDFDEDRYGARKNLGELTFEKLDADSDDMITLSDVAQIEKEHLLNLLNAIENDDDEWLKNNHDVRLTSAWFKEHFALRPNKEVLPKLDLPIHIFSGEYDNMTPMQHALDIDAEFNRLGKNNLTLHTFENHDHDLNCVKYIVKNEFSEGFTAIFDTVDDI